MCDWWLSHIEKKADQYLKDCGYGHDVIPENYTKEKPKDLDSLKKNLSIVQDLIEGESEELDNFVDETTLEVYEMLERLLHEIEFVLKRDWKRTNFGLKFTEEDIESVKKDYEYLMKVKQMDLELKEKRKQKNREKEPLRMTDAVPVSGLVMARFHIFRAECQTSLMIWEKKMSPTSDLRKIADQPKVLEHLPRGDNLFGYCWSEDTVTAPSRDVSVRHFGDWVWAEEEVDFEKGEEAPPKLSLSNSAQRSLLTQSSQTWRSSGNLFTESRVKKGSGVWKKTEPVTPRDLQSKSSLLHSPSSRGSRSPLPISPPTSKIQNPTRNSLPASSSSDVPQNGSPGTPPPKTQKPHSFHTNTNRASPPFHSPSSHRRTISPCTEPPPLLPKTASKNFFFGKERESPTLSLSPKREPNNIHQAPNKDIPSILSKNDMRLSFHRRHEEEEENWDLFE